MNFERKCIKCVYFPCMREECKKDGWCYLHKFSYEKMIEELDSFKEDKFEK